MLVLAYCALTLTLARSAQALRGLPLLLHLQWALLVGTYLLFSAQFVPLQTETQVVICGFLIAFTIGYVLGPIPVGEVIPRRKFLPRWGFYAVAAGLAAISLTKGLGLLLTAGGFADLRTLLGSGDRDAPSIGIAASFPMASSAWLLARRERDRLATLAFAILTFALAIVTTSKVFLFICLLQLIPVRHEWRLATMIRIAVGFTVVGLGAFAALHLMLGKVVGGDAPLGILLARTLLTYLLSGIAGLNVLFQGDAIFPANSMWITIGGLVPWWLDIPVSPILPWVRIGEWNGNVFTAFSYWLDGWGPAGFLPWCAALGLLVRTVQQHTGAAAQAMFSLTVFAVLMTFHQDFFLPSLYLWVAFGAAAVLVHFVRSSESSSDVPT